MVLGMCWRGSEGSGPCPACKGTDRGWVHAHRQGGDRITVGCRHCENRDELRAALDHRLGPEPPDPTWLRAAVLSDRKWKRRVAPSPTRNEASPAAPRSPDAKVEGARRLWAAGVAPEGTPAALHLVSERRVWPPTRQFPESVRWLPRSRAPRLKGGLPPLPGGAAGATLYRFETPGGELRALQAEALAPDGSRLLWSGNRDLGPGPKRRTVGPIGGAGFPARPDPGSGPVLIAEGPADALALAVLYPEVAVLAAGGAWSFGTLGRAVARGRVVFLVGDADGPGRLAALRAVDAIRDSGGTPGGSAGSTPTRRKFSQR